MRSLIFACTFLACATAARAQGTVKLTPLANGITVVTTTDGRYLGHLVATEDGRYVVETPQQGASIILHNGVPGAPAAPPQTPYSSTVNSPALASQTSAHGIKHAAVPTHTRIH
jgi:hypothetical protein